MSLTESEQRILPVEIPPRTLAPPPSLPLVIDLDECLLRTDVLWESLLQMLVRQPSLSTRLPGWLLQGKAWFKREVAFRTRIDAEQLPFRDEILQYARSARLEGRRVVLATASDALPARQIAEQAGCFDDVLAGNGVVNLKGEAKLAAIRNLIGRETPFEYIGDVRGDGPVFEAATASTLVVRFPRERGSHPARKLLVSGGPLGLLRQWAAALRVHQWAKNLLVFLPLLLAHTFGAVVPWIAATVAFFAFSISASGIYVFNDLIDLASDRSHPRKRERPFAAGHLPIRWGVAASPLLLVIGLLLGMATGSPDFVVILGLYVLSALAYALVLRRAVLVDVVTLAALYAFRLFAGSAVTGVVLSPWLLALALFLFFSLALLKRYTELLPLRENGLPQARGRGYIADDLDLLRSLGTASGLLSVLVLALYINSDQVAVHYRHPDRLWLIGPLLMYWISWLWITAHRGQMHDDPIVFTLRNRRSHFILATVVVLAVSAIL